MNNKTKEGSNANHAFTVIELLIVIVIIGILASLTIIAYSGITSRSSVSSLQADLTNNAKKLKLYQAQYGTYPTSINTTTGCPTAPTASSDPSFCLADSGSNVISSYRGTSIEFNLRMNSGGTYYQISESSTPIVSSSIGDGSYMQVITSTNCPSTRTRAVDARDNHTYWVQKLADGKCWMLTNLGYAGGGTNTYGDVRTLSNGTSLTQSDTIAYYYVVPSTTNFTSEPTDPSISTDGTGQYGYLYNFCGANGGQTGNGACSGADSTAVNTAISACPSGWRLPTGNPGEISALNTAVNGGSTSSDAGLIASPWLGQRSGYYQFGSISGQGGQGWYATTSQYSVGTTYFLRFAPTYAGPFNLIGNKNYGFAVRCVAN